MPEPALFAIAAMIGGSSAHEEGKVHRLKMTDPRVHRVVLALGVVVFFANWIWSPWVYEFFGQYHWVVGLVFVAYLIDHASNPMMDGQREWLVIFTTCLVVATMAIALESTRAFRLMDQEMVYQVHGAAIFFGCLALMMSALNTRASRKERNWTAWEVEEGVAAVDPNLGRWVAEKHREMGIHAERPPGDADRGDD